MSEFNPHDVHAARTEMREEELERQRALVRTRIEEFGEDTYPMGTVFRFTVAEGDGNSYTYFLVKHTDDGEGWRFTGRSTWFSWSRIVDILLTEYTETITFDRLQQV